MWLLYQAAMLAALVLAGPLLLVKRGRHYLPTLYGRFGRSQHAPAAHPLWIHAVSVGEVEVAATFLRNLSSEDAHPPLITTVTPTGQQRAQSLMGKTARVAYLPFELGFAQTAFLRRNSPACLVLVEGELWPLLQRNLKKRSIPIVMVNGRISDRSFRRLQVVQRIAPAALRPLLDPVDHFGVQSAQDRDRLLALDVDSDRVSVTGNLKFDAAAPAALDELAELVRQQAGERDILVAGSTMAREEELVLDAYAQLCESDSATPPMLILAPRHPERFLEVEQLCLERQLACTRRSTLDPASSTSPATNAQPDILLLDTLGELASTYRWSKAAFVGGTLVPTGGHNPIEPARCGAPTVVGPSMENFKEIAAAFDAEKAWAQVDSAAGLAEVWRRWLEQPDQAEAVAQRATQLLESNTGATARSIELLRRFAPVALKQAAISPKASSAEHEPSETNQ